MYSLEVIYKIEESPNEAKFHNLLGHAKEIGYNTVFEKELLKLLSKKAYPDSKEDAQLCIFGCRGESIAKFEGRPHTEVTEAT